MYRNRLFFIALLTFILLGISGGLLNIAWTYMQDSFDVEASSLGVLLFFGTLGSLIAAFGSGTLVNRFGVGLATLTGISVVAMGLAGVALSSTWLMLIGVAFFLSIGRGTLDAGLNNYISVNHSATQMSWLHASWGVGLTIAPLVMTFFIITLDTSWRAGYAAMAALAFLLALLVAVNRKNWDVEDPSNQEQAQTQSRPLRETLQMPVVLWSMAVFFVYGGIEIGTGQLANTLLVDSRNLSQEVASLWISIYWGSFTVGRILIGLVALRYQTRQILWACIALAAIGELLLVAGSNTPILNFVGLASIGLGLSAIFPLLIAQTPQRVGKSHAANTIGFQVGVAGFGAAVIPGIISFLTKPFGLETISYGLLLNALLLIAVTYWLLTRYPATRPTA